MQVCREIQRAIKRLGVRSVELSTADAAAVLSELSARHANPGHRPLWERLKAPGERNSDGWMKAASFFEGELIILSDADEKPFGFRLAAVDVNRLLEDCFGFVFYLADDSLFDLVCFTDHDVLIVSRLPRFALDVWGEVRAADSGVERVKITRAAGGFLFVTLERGRECDVWLETLEEVEADLAELKVDWPRT